MDISLKDLFHLLTRNLLLIGICLIIGFAAAFSISKFAIQPTYISTVKLYVYATDSSDSAANDYSNLNDLNYAQKIVNTYIEMLRTNSFFKAVHDQSSLGYSIVDLEKMVSFTVLNDTEIFQVSVSSHKPEDSKQIADVITELAPKTISSIKDSANLRVVDSASFPTDPSSPNVTLNSVVGALLGLVAAVVYILLKEMLDIRIRGEEDVAARYKIPVLGSIPAFDTNGVRSIVFESKEEKR